MAGNKKKRERENIFLNGIAEDSAWTDAARLRELSLKHGMKFL